MDRALRPWIYPEKPSPSPTWFVEKWRLSSLKESSGYQEHFRDLCHLIGHPTPSDADLHNECFGFQMGAQRLGDTRGWADVAKKGFFAWEYKSKHANVDKAYQQILKYREMLENPPLLVICDFDTILIRTNITNTPTQRYTLTLDDLLTPTGLRTLREIFFDPYALYLFDAPPMARPITAPAIPPSGDLATTAFADVVELLQLAHDDFALRRMFLGWEVRWFNHLPVAYRKNGDAYWRIPTGSKPFVEHMGKSAVQHYGIIWGQRDWILLENGATTNNKGIPKGSARCLCILDSVLHTWKHP